LQEHNRRSLQQDDSDASEQPSGSGSGDSGGGVQIDYSVVASRDISAAFTADDFVARFVAAVNSLNSSALPVLNASDVAAQPPSVQTNVSFSVQIPEARTAAIAEAEQVLSENPEALVELAAAGPCHAAPCRNGAACRETVAGGFACDCVNGWVGELCETEPPPPPPPPPALPAGSVVATLSIDGDVASLAGEEVRYDFPFLCLSRACLGKTLCVCPEPVLAKRSF